MGLKNFQVKNVDVNTHLLLRIKFGQYLVSSEFLWSKQAFVNRLDDLMTIDISTRATQDTMQIETKNFRYAACVYS